jgi:hypothetical protein
MKLTNHDWKVLQPSLIALGVVLAVTSLLLLYTRQQKELAVDALQVQQSRLSQARNRFQTSGAEKETIVKYMPLYLGLVRRGFIGEERRIEWIDQLRNINQQYKLFGINYSIGAQEIYKAPLNLVLGAFVLHRSKMKIDTPLLHEGDLLIILNAMDKDDLAPFILQDCTLTKIATITRARFVPNLNASCEIDWLTVSEPARTGNPP